jgi:SAM-dependent methyltransferase
MPEHEHWFEEIADHAGAAYLRYSFTKGTEQEVGFLVDVLGLEPGMRVLDVGCGPGRHAHAFARRGVEVHGIDISQRFVDLATETAPSGATFERLDARRLAFDGEFDVAMSLCQGAFGLLGGTDDGDVLAGMRRAVKPGRRVVVSAFSAYFQLRWLEEQDSFDAARGVNVEQTSVKDEAGTDKEFTLETTCFTPRELRLLAERAGLRVEHLWSVTPGAYARTEPTIDTPEFLLVASRVT